MQFLTLGSGVGVLKFSTIGLNAVGIGDEITVFFKGLLFFTLFVLTILVTDLFRSDVCELILVTLFL
jgi:hypothetical protein